MRGLDNAIFSIKMINVLMSLIKEFLLIKKKIFFLFENE